jgi:hypothetical protein
VAKVTRGNYTQSKENQEYLDRQAGKLVKDGRFTKGRYRGCKVLKVWKFDPSYIEWAQKERLM